MKFDIHKKEREGLLYENGAGEKIVSHSKLKLWTFFWGHAECELPLVSIDKHVSTHYTSKKYMYNVILWDKDIQSLSAGISRDIAIKPHIAFYTMHAVFF